MRGVLPESCQEQLEILVSWRFIVTLWTVTISCYQFQDIPLDLSQPITGSLASQYFNSSVIGDGSIYSVKMLRSTALMGDGTDRTTDIMTTRLNRPWGWCSKNSIYFFSFKSTLLFFKPGQERKRHYTLPFYWREKIQTTGEPESLNLCG